MDESLRSRIVLWLAAFNAGYHHHQAGARREMLTKISQRRLEEELDLMHEAGLVGVREDGRVVATDKLKASRPDLWSAARLPGPPEAAPEPEPIVPENESTDALYRAIRDSSEASRKARIRAGGISEGVLDTETGSWVQRGWTMKEIAQRVNAPKPDIFEGLSEETIDALAKSYDKRMARNRSLT